MSGAMFALARLGSQSFTRPWGSAAWSGAFAANLGRDWDTIAFLLLLIVALRGLAWALLARRK